MSTTPAPAAFRRPETAPAWQWRLAAVAVAALALIGGLALRIWMSSPLWLDEALSVRIAALEFGDMTDALRHDGHPSLYYLLLGWWMDVFGDSNAAARSLSGVASLFTVPLLWSIGHRRSAAVGWIAGIVALSSPFLLRYGTEARMYALLTLFVALAWWATERAIERPTLARLAIVAGSVAGLLHTHYWSFWLLGAAGLLLLRSFATEHGPSRPTTIRLGAAMAIGGATFIPWLGIFLDQLSSTGTPWADRARPAEIAVETMQALGGNNRFEGELLGVILIGLAIIGALGAHRAGAIELRLTPGPLSAAAATSILALGIGGLVALATAGAFEGRYAAVIVPFALVLAARGIALVPEPARTVLLGLIVVFGLAVGVDEARRDRTQAGDVAAAIDLGHEAGDVVAFCPDQVGPATRRELTTEVQALAYPRGVGQLVDWRDYADTIDASPASAFVESLIASADGGDIWLVTGLGYKSLGSRCEEVIATLDRTHVADHLISPSETFERMLLTRYEVRP